MSLQLNGLPTTLLIDSGASVNVLPLHVYQKGKQQGSELLPTSTRVYPYGSSQQMTLKSSRKFTVSTACLLLFIFNCNMTLFFKFCFFLYFLKLSLSSTRHICSRNANRFYLCDFTVVYHAETNAVLQNHE